MLQTIGFPRQNHGFSPTKAWVFSDQTIGFLRPNHRFTLDKHTRWQSKCKDFLMTDDTFFRKIVFL